VAVPLLTLAVLLVVSALSAASEIALLSLDPLKLETAERAGSKVARLIKRLRANPQRILTTLLILNNVVNAAIAAVGSAFLLSLLAAEGEAAAWVLPVATLAIAIVITVLGDLIPKTVGAVRNQQIAALTAFPLHWLDRLLTPLHVVVGVLVTPIVRLLTGGRTSAEDVPTREEMFAALTLAHASGTLHSMDMAVAKEALHFSQIDLRDVMTPRVDVAGIEESQSLGAALRLMKQTGYSRLPVYRATLDEITGVILIKDMITVLAGEAEEGVAQEWFNEPVAGHVREVAYYPESKSVVDALAEIRTLRSHLAVVVDEHGGTAGIVTLEDILEELIGDIRDESDPDHSIDIVSSGEGWLIATGRARVDSVPALAALAENGGVDSTSIGGLLMEKLGRPAVVGDIVELDGGAKVSALKVHRNRIKLVRVEFPVETPEEVAAAS
jgi:putative hemolysin